jgi:RNA polymerase sigma-70 factor, ECF subfamily
VTGASEIAWEVRCVEEARRGSRRAFGELYAAFARPLYREVLLPRLGSAAAAEEALAETFRAALEKLGDYRPQGGSLFGWLARIAANKATDLHRERARTGKALASFESLVAPLREAGQGAEQRLDQRRLEAAVAQALGDVLPRYRRAIELRMLEDLPRPECAQRMEITLGNFDVLLLRALRAFRAAWVARRGEKEDA